MSFKNKESKFLPCIAFEILAVAQCMMHEMFRTMIRL